MGGSGLDGQRRMGGYTHEGRSHTRHEAAKEEREQDDDEDDEDEVDTLGWAMCVCSCPEHPRISQGQSSPKTNCSRRVQSSVRSVGM